MRPGPARSRPGPSSAPARSPTAARTAAPASRWRTVASNAVSGLIARAYQDRFGLSVPQWRLICVLAEDGGLTQGQIVARTVMDKVTVSRAAQGLLKRHMVERSDHQADGRSHVLALTDQGRRLHEEIAPLALAYEAALIAGLAP